MFEHNLKSIPETRAGYRANELPICQRDIRTLAQVHGEQVAEAARFTAQCIMQQGGINPNCVKNVFPEGLNGPMNEDMLLRVIASYAIWSEQPSL